MLTSSALPLARFNTAIRQGSVDSGGSTQPSGGDNPGGGNTHNTATTGNTGGSAPATGASSGSGGGHMDPEEQVRGLSGLQWWCPSYRMAVSLHIDFMSAPH